MLILRHGLGWGRNIIVQRRRSGEVPGAPSRRSERRHRRSEPTFRASACRRCSVGAVALQRLRNSAGAHPPRALIAEFAPAGPLLAVAAAEYH